MFRFQHIYGQDYPRARVDSAREMLAPGSPLRNGWKQRLRRRRCSPPQTPHYLIESRASGDPTEEGATATPDAPTRPSAYGVLQEDEELYGAGSWVHKSAPPAYPPPPTFRARDILIRPPFPCPWWKPKTAPQHNAAAQQAGLHQRTVKLVSWNEIHPHEIQDGFLEALFREDAYQHHVPPGLSEEASRAARLHFEDAHPGEAFPDIENAPSFSRPLATEADAAELFCTNIALGVRDALNELLKPNLRANATTPGIRVEIESQARIGDGHEASALDFVLSLVSWPLDIKANAFRFHLVSVEMKRPGYVVPADWKAPTHKRSMDLNPKAHALATQLFWYTRRDPQHVERHLISDYLNSVAVAVEKDSVHESHPGEVIMAAVPVTYVNVQHRIHDQRERTRKFYSSSKPPFEVPIKSPFEGGPRLALLYLAFEALRAYGVLNQRLFPDVENWTREDGSGTLHHETIPVHPAVVKFYKHAPVPGRRLTISPTLGLRGNPHGPSSAVEDPDASDEGATAAVTKQMGGLHIRHHRRGSHSSDA